MTVEMSGYRSILVATDFSPHAEAALKQAVWLARQSGAKIVLAHTLRDLRHAVHATSAEARIDLFRGEGERFQREVRQSSDAKMSRQIASLDAGDVAISFETLLGEPFVELTHAVQAEGYDLVMAGTRGLAGWQQFFVGSTARRLIRKCPAPVWIVKAEHSGPPKVVLAATDFSDVGRKAVEQGLWVAKRSNADFHLLHVVDAEDVPGGDGGRPRSSDPLGRRALREHRIGRAAEHGADRRVRTRRRIVRRHTAWSVPHRGPRPDLESRRTGSLTPRARHDVSQRPCRFATECDS